MAIWQLIGGFGTHVASGSSTSSLVNHLHRDDNIQDLRILHTAHRSGVAYNRIYHTCSLLICVVVRVVLNEMETFVCLLGKLINPHLITPIKQMSVPWRCFLATRLLGRRNEGQ
jgi:hypothetical protein